MPINPKATKVNEIPAYHSLEEAANEHDLGLLVYVIPAKLTLASLEIALKLGLTKV